MRRRRIPTCIAALCLVVWSGLGFATCTTDVVCADDCRTKICSDSDPGGNPNAAYGDCIDACRDAQTNCAGWVTCMKGCAETRDKALARCRSAKQSCIRQNCRVCTGAQLERGGAAAVLSPACVDNCRKARTACKTKAGQARFAIRVCRSKCQDRCGPFAGDFPAALSQCIDNCGGPIEPGCGADFQTCRDGCVIP